MIKNDTRPLNLCSSELRALCSGFAGLWGAGSGRIHTPLASSMFFLPQKPFMPLGTLRQQLIFPAGIHIHSILDRIQHLKGVTDEYWEIF